MDDFIAKARSDDELTREAYRLRVELGLDGSTEYVDMVEVLEKRVPRLIPGFEVIIQDDAVMHGAQASTTSKPPRMFFSVSTWHRLTEGDARARFTAAHELAHLFLHPGEIRHRMVDVKARPRFIEPARSGERQANRHAAAFLLPHWLAERGKSAEDLARRCGVSLKAAQIAFATYVEGRKERKIPEDYLDQFRREMREADGSALGRGYNRAAPQSEEAIIAKLWNELDIAPDHAPDMYRLVEGKWLVCRREYKKLSNCGWTIAGGRILPLCRTDGTMGF